MNAAVGDGRNIPASMRMRAGKLARPLGAIAALLSAAPAAGAEATFARDVAPILQSHCQGCHRPGTAAPMSLLTYEDARPWARAIRVQVTRREMPPWRLAADAVAHRFKNDPSLTQTQIDTIARWVDAGAPLGDPADLPSPIAWPQPGGWTNGTPDVVLTLPRHTVPAAGADAWADYVIDTGLLEDRYIQAVETKPSAARRQVVHHVVTFLVQDGSRSDDSYLSEYAVGKGVEAFPADAGRAIRRKAKLRVNVHYHPVGQEIAEETQIGLFFYPRGEVPRHEVRALTVGLLLLDDDIDIPANAVTTHEAYSRLASAARLISFQPHMHLRGKAMTLEALYPSGRREILGAVDHYQLASQLTYIYDEATAPVLPAGTVLHAVATYDNTAANRNNPDPSQWVGWGNRTVDEMFQCHVWLVSIDDLR